MADFYTHIGTSTVLGLGYAAWGNYVGVPLETTALAAGLCGVAGMGPDLDSDSGIPARESFAFAAAVAPALMIDRFQHFGWSNETIALATGAIYVFVRFGISRLFKLFTVHRGMWHSIPACVISGLITFLVASREEFSLRLYLSVAVMLGFFSHLLLDEIWSLQLSGRRVGVKKSWGTALKFFGDSTLSNLGAYLLLFALAAAAVGDPVAMKKGGFHHDCPWLATFLGEQQSSGDEYDLYSDSLVEPVEEQAAQSRPTSRR